MKHARKKTDAAVSAMVPLTDEQLREVSGAGIGSGGRARFDDLSMTKTTDKATPIHF